MKNVLRFYFFVFSFRSREARRKNRSRIRTRDDIAGRGSSARTHVPGTIRRGRAPRRLRTMQRFEARGKSQHRSALRRKSYGRAGRHGPIELFGTQQHTTGLVYLFLVWRLYEWKLLKNQIRPSLLRGWVFRIRVGAGDARSPGRFRVLSPIRKGVPCKSRTGNRCGGG